MVKSKNDIVFELLCTLIITIIGLVCLVPILFVVSYSLTPMAEVLKNGGFVLIPRQITFSAYKDMLSSATLMNAMKVNLFVTVVGTFLNLIVTIMLAYPLSRVDLPGRALCIKMIVFTMIFSAGTVPTFLTVKNTGLLDSLWALIIPSLVSVYNFIVMKSFFEGLPSDLFESARIDGAGEMCILIRLVLPLSLPIITTIALYYAVGHWNTYTAAIYYLQTTSKMPLQVILRRMIASASANEVSADEIIPPETLRMAAVCIATAPVVIIYPFIQKYFVKGTLAGAVKG
jgi:putative aldouronate transport system permease protein